MTSPQETFNPITPHHYKRLKIEPWDYIAANNLGYFEGSVIKYVSRWTEKNGIEDLKKAKAFLDRLIRQQEELASHSVKEHRRKAIYPQETD